MSVIVKGMEMPKNCTRCDYIGLNAAIGCSVMSGTNGRATDCPLGALPDKHGRLIDANEIPWNHGANGDVVVYPDTIAEMMTIVEAEDSE